MNNKSMKNLNEISLLKNRVFVEPSTGEISDEMIRYLNTDLSLLGFVLSREVLDVVKTLASDEFNEFYHLVQTKLKEMVGDHVNYSPLFKNFPDQVPNDSIYNMKRIFTQIQNNLGVRPDNYTLLSCGHFIDHDFFDLSKFGACPICQMQVSELSGNFSNAPLEKFTPLRVIRLADEEFLNTKFTEILQSNSSISEKDMKFVSLLIQEKDMNNLIPNDIPMKEILAFLSAELYKRDGNFDKVKGFYKTSTDILRLAAALCDGDISLKDKTRFKFNNKLRRELLELFETVSTNNKNVSEDMKRYRGTWLALGEVIHPGSYKNKYPNAFEMFDVIRNSPKSIETFNSKLEFLLENKSEKFDELLAHLSHRPGEFVRRLDYLLANSDDSHKLLDAFNSVIQSVTTKMLLVLRQHLRSRCERKDFRYFIPKGQISKIQFRSESLNPLDKETVDKFVEVITSELQNRFQKSEKSLTGNVFIDENLKNSLIPLSERSASDNLDSVPRGSKLKVPDSDVLRFFVYWKENERTYRLDVDLSATFYNSNWEQIGTVSYFSLGGMNGVKHSGDIQSAPDGASEFVDIFRNQISKDSKYVIMSINVYSGLTFKNFECFAGVMTRNKYEKFGDNSGKLFDPTTIHTKFTVNSESMYTIPVILDLENNELTWADMNVSARNLANVSTHENVLTGYGPAILSMSNDKPNMFDLVYDHAAKSAKKIDTVRDKDTKYDYEFSWEDLDINDIVANWLK